MDISPDGQYLAVASGLGAGFISLYNLNSRRIEKQWQTPLLSINSISFSADSQRLASGGMGDEEEMIQIWRVGPMGLQVKSSQKSV